MIVSKELFFAEIDANGMRDFFSRKGNTHSTDGEYRLVQYTDVHKDIDESDINTKKVFMWRPERRCTIVTFGKETTEIRPEQFHLFGAYYDARR